MSEFRAFVAFSFLKGLDCFLVFSMSRHHIWLAWALGAAIMLCRGRPAFRTGMPGTPLQLCPQFQLSGSAEMAETGVSCNGQFPAAWCPALAWLLVGICRVSRAAPATPHSIWVLVQDLAVSLLIQILADVPGKAAENDLRALGTATFVGDPDEAPGLFLPGPAMPLQPFGE